MRVLFCLVVLCAVSTASCTPDKSVVQNLPGLPSGTDLQAKSKPNATSIAIDEYLTWLDKFQDGRTEALFAIEQDARQKSRDAMLTARANPQSSPASVSPQQLMGALNGFSESQKPLIAVYTQNYNTFRQKTPPAECATLANLYATFLYKQLSSANAMQAQMEKMNRAMNMPEGTQPPQDTSFDPSAMDSGTEEMLKANEELRNLYKKYPALKTPGFQLK